MRRAGFQSSIRALVVLVAAVAVNLWCFRLHPVAGLVALNLSKHVLIADFCRAAGINRRDGPPSTANGSPDDG